MASYQVNQKLSEIIYGLKNKDIKYSIPFEIVIDGSLGVWKLANSIAVRTQNPDPDVLKNEYYSEDGYAGAVYINDAAREVIIVNAGTSNGMDYVNDVEMAIGSVPGQYNSIRQIGQDAVTLGNALGYIVSATGHSKGGSDAQFQGVLFNIPIVTFNAYGIEKTLENISSNPNLAELYPELANGYKNQAYDIKHMI